MIKEFKPTLLFLIKFLIIYLVGNLIYGAWVTDWYPLPDPMTSWVTEQSTSILKLAGWEVTWQNQVLKPTTYINYYNRPTLAVYEGCNGLNVMIIFLAFMLAFGPYRKSLLWFVPSGLVLIHLANLTRIILLFHVSLLYPDYFYFIHKYLFTAFIYVVVFILWVIWVYRYTDLKNKSHAVRN